MCSLGVPALNTIYSFIHYQATSTKFQNIEGIALVIILLTVLVIRNQVLLALKKKSYNTTLDVIPSVNSE